MEVISRPEARKRGLARLFTGKPCKWGHIAERYVSYNGCVQCVFERSRTGTEIERLRAIHSAPEAKIRHAVRGWKNRGMPMPTRPAPGVCEICGSVPGKRALALDHDHTTNKFRGWLCSNCNHALGKIGDSLEALRDWASKAERYLISARADWEF